jgi:hypothetical protein
MTVACGGDMECVLVIRFEIFPLPINKEFGDVVVDRVDIK